MPDHKSPRRSYHHGNLASALTQSAIDLARVGGPEAVVLREAARQVGVSATAAYRHFASHGELLNAVKDEAGAALAAAMQVELDREPALPDPGKDARRRLRALGAGYIRFALAEPGLFRTAFCRADPREYPDGLPDLREFPAYRMLAETLDDLANHGQIGPEYRSHAESAAWALVHGLAVLLLDGPLVLLSEEEREEAITRSLDLAVGGICQS